MSPLSSILGRFGFSQSGEKPASVPEMTLEQINDPESYTRTSSFWATLPWGRVLVWFLRITACVWLAKGILSWMTIVGLNGSIEGRALTFQATVVYFAVLDLVAAVGLWLLSTWGGVLWLLAVMSHVTLNVFFPRIVVLNPSAMAAFMAMVALYILFSLLASHQEF